MSAPVLGAALLAVAAVLVLTGMHTRTRARERRERDAMLDDLVPLFDDADLERDPADMPRLAGTVDGHRYTVRVLVDSLTLRKLPVLWLEITAHRSLPVSGPVTVLRRPQGTEFFSPDGSFDHELVAPDDWPRPSRVATPDPARAPDLHVLDPALPLLREPRTKELALGPRGVRVVRLAAECDRASYRTTRRAVFGPVRIPRDEVGVLIGVLTTIGDHAGPPAPLSVRSHS